MSPRSVFLCWLLVTASPLGAAVISVPGWQWTLPESEGWQIETEQKALAIHADGRRVSLAWNEKDEPATVARAYREAWQRQFSQAVITKDEAVAFGERQAWQLQLHHHFADGEQHWSAWFIQDAGHCLVWLASGPDVSGLSLPPPSPTD